MCGRFTLRARLNDLLAQFAIEDNALEEWEARYNVAPTQDVPVVRMAEGRRQLAALQWGLVPSWAKDAKIGYSMINARAETVAEKPAFRTAYRKRRCLVVADGYYEWKREGKAKLPFLYEIGGRPFAFAGLWESWHGLETCTIITTEANALAEAVHDRMPVILHPTDYEAWLNPTTAGPHYLLEPFPSEEMSVHPVSTYVNNTRHEGPDCVAHLTEGEG